MAGKAGSRNDQRIGFVSAMKITSFKFTRKSFEAWRRKQEFSDAETANLAWRFGANLREWERGGNRSPAFAKIMHEDLAELQRRMASHQ